MTKGLRMPFGESLNSRLLWIYGNMTLKIEDIDYIVVHCSATKASQDVTVKDIDRWHRERGWNGIGYHFVIERDGRIQGGRPLMEVGAHAYGYNRVSWGICLIGGLDEAGEAEDNFTDEQKTALASLIQSLRGKRNGYGIEVLGHRDLSPDVDGDGIIEPWEWKKECPCFDVRAWMQEVGLQS